MGRKKYQIFQLILFMAKKGYNKAENMGFYEPKKRWEKRWNKLKINIVSDLFTSELPVIFYAQIFSLSNRYIKKKNKGQNMR